MKKIEPMKILGIVATVIGIAASTLSSYVEEKTTDAKIEEKVRKALAEAKTENETKEE